MSETFQKALLEKIRLSLKKAYPNISEEELSQIEVTVSSQEKFGHYQCNSAMKLAKSLKIPPRAIGESVAKFLSEDNVTFKKVDVEGPGFINITLNDQLIAKKVDQMILKEDLDIEKVGTFKKIVIDFSSPNIAKEMHVGHLRSTIIGDSLARIFEFQGYDVLRLNHLGDWGTAFGMLIAYLKEKRRDLLEKKESATLTDLVIAYKESKKLFDEDPDFKKRSQQEVVKLQSGDKEALSLWKIICEISQKAYQEIYDLLDIKLIERGESFYNPMLLDLIKELEDKGEITVSDGAKCLFIEGFKNREGEPLPLMLQKSDGGFGYDTTDMAAIKHRIFEEKGDRLIYVTDLGQATHFEMIFEAAKKVGFLNPQKTRVDHVGFGLVLGSDNKKFKTRSGETEKLIDLLNTAIIEAEKILLEKTPHLTVEERHHAAKILGLGAVKYSDLSTHRTSDYQFAYDKMLRFEGNTAAFILYSYVRVFGIKRKLNLQEIPKEGHITLTHPSEIALALHLSRFSETIELVAETLLPNRLTDYLYTLAEKFNAFFRDCQVIGSEQEISRIRLAEATARVLKKGLNLLGIETLERM